MMKADNELRKFSKDVERGLNVSFEKLFAFKKYKNTPLVISENDKIVEIHPDEFEDYFKIKAKSKNYKKEITQDLVREPSNKSKKDNS